MLSVSCCWVAGLAWKSVAFCLMKCMALEPPLNLPIDRTQALKLDVTIGFRPGLTVRALAGGLTLGRGQRAGSCPLLCLLWPICGWAWLSTLGFLPSSFLEIQSLSTQHGMSKMGSIWIRFLVERRLLGKSCGQDQPQQVAGVSSPDRGIVGAGLGSGKDTMGSWSLGCLPAMGDSQCPSTCLGIRGHGLKSLHLTLHFRL